MSTYLYISLIKPRKYNLSGETDANKNGLIQGQSNTPLSKIGIEQAKKIGEKFSSTKFDVAIFDVAIFKKKLGQRMDNEDFTINQINNNYIIHDNIKINNVNNDDESITINYPQITNSDLQNEEQVIIFYSFMIIY